MSGQLWNTDMLCSPDQQDDTYTASYADKIEEKWTIPSVPGRIVSSATCFSAKRMHDRPSFCYCKATQLKPGAALNEKSAVQSMFYGPHQHLSLRLCVYIHVRHLSLISEKKWFYVKSCNPSFVAPTKVPFQTASDRMFRATQPITECLEPRSPSIVNLSQIVLWPCISYELLHLPLHTDCTWQKYWSRFCGKHLHQGSEGRNRSSHGGAGIIAERKHSSTPKRIIGRISWIHYSPPLLTSSLTIPNHDTKNHDKKRSKNRMQFSSVYSFACISDSLYATIQDTHQHHDKDKHQHHAQK